MGPYLSKADTRKDSEFGGDNRCMFSATSMQGWRNS
jgi:serine/threonine protein phosphatase PrpC